MEARTPTDMYLPSEDAKFAENGPSGKAAPTA